MKQPILIQQIIAMLNKGYADETIVYDLKQEGNSDETIYSALDAAKTEYMKESLKRQIRINKVTHYAFMALSIITFLVFLIVLPRLEIGIGHVFILSLLGSCLTAFFAFFSIVYYNSWDKNFVQSTGRPSIDFSMMVLMLAPVIVLHFLLSWRFSSAQESRLKDQQVEVIGRIIDGSSFQAKRVFRGGTVADFSEVTVEFETKEGQKMRVTKDISAYEFKDFYKDQDVRMVYSKNNPRNIDFIVNEEDVRQYKGIQERDLEPNDLVRLIGLDENQITLELSKISEGWAFNPQNDEWSNSKRKATLTLKPKQLILVGIPQLNFNYPHKLTQIGFIKTSKESTEDPDFSKKIFQKDEFTFTVEGSQERWNSTIVLNKR
jgi:hypothetical protein